MDPIIDPEQWMAVKSTLETRAAEHRKTGTDVRNLLAGFLVCATCGHKMRSAPGGSRARKYRCATQGGHCANKVSIVADPLDDLIVKLIAAKLAEQAEYTVSETAADPAAKVAELTARLDLLAEQWADGKLTDKAYAAATRATEKKIAVQRAEAEKQAKARIVLPGPDAVTAWTSGTLHERRALLEMLITQIVISPMEQVARFGNVFDPHRVHVAWRPLDG